MGDIVRLVGRRWMIPLSARHENQSERLTSGQRAALEDAERRETIADEIIDIRIVPATSKQNIGVTIVLSNGVECTKILPLPSWLQRRTT